MRKLLFIVCAIYICTSQVKAQSGWNVSGNPITTSEDVKIDGSLTVYKKKVELVDKSNGAADGMGIKYLNISDMGLYADYKIQFLESDQNLVKFHFDLNEGKMGVGTTSPSALLNIYHPTRTIGIPANFNDGYLKLSNAANQQMALDPNQIYASTELNIQTAGNYPIELYTNNAKRMRILGNGAVAIGTETVPSGYKLAVDGKTITEEIKVEVSGNWPDYVFSPEYDLKSLEETETFINENHRLPDMPSAEEAETNGIELGEMNRLVVEKLEEVTLHLIRLEKENNNLKAELSQRQKAIGQSQLKVEELTLHIIELEKRLNKLENEE